MRTFHVDGHAGNITESNVPVKVLKSLQYNCHEVTSRKEHKCLVCRMVILKGEKTLSFYQRVDSHPYGCCKWYACEACYKVLPEVGEEQTCKGYGNMCKCDECSRADQNLFGNQPNERKA